MGAYIYESHLGGYYASEDYIPSNNLYCESCGDSDWNLGQYDTFRQFLEEKANEIDCDDGLGGYSLESVIDDVGWAFEDKLTYDEAKEIVLANRTDYDDE